MESKKIIHVSENPQLLEEWNWEKNSILGFEPTIMTCGSNKKVWWRCKKGHEWKAEINSRNYGRGCPFCSGIKVLIGFNDLATIDPKLSKEWHPIKNGRLSPQDFTYGSNKKIWWMCSKGHEWEAAIKSRRLGRGCPFCSGNKVLIGFNDLATVNPLLATQWHPTKNGSIKPTDIQANSSKKVWWLCEQGHEWEAIISNRNGGTGCPVCANKQVLAGINDLATINPILASEWHPSRNGKLTPKDVTVGSSKKVWWQCKKGHEWQATVSHRSSGEQCPKCSEELRTSFPEQAIFYYCKRITNAYNRYLFDSRTEIDVYLPEYRIGIEYDGVYFHKSKDAQRREKRKQELLDAAGIILIRIKETDGNFICQPQTHIIFSKSCPSDEELKLTIRLLFEQISQITHTSFVTDIDISRDRYDIFDQYIKSEKEKSLSVMNPKLAAEWHPTKNNGFLPEYVSISSNKLVCWKCVYGHEWQATINSRNCGNGCPVCSRHKVLTGFNDLATVNPALAAQWHPTKNGTTKPTDVTEGSGRSFWWICENNHEWKATISHRKMGSGCPYCSNKTILAGYNDLATVNPTLAAQWHPTKNGSMKPTDVTANSGKIVWWLCKNGHEWKGVIAHRNYGGGCPICSGRKVLIGYNDLATVNPVLAVQWHPNKNGDIKPTGVTANSKKKVWWICEKGHEWEALIGDRTRGQNCPICANKRIQIGFNDLETVFPQLAKEWHPTKNGELLPSSVTVGSKKKVWWLCSACGHEWEAVIHTRSAGHGCPKCAKQKMTGRKKKSS